MAKTRASYAFEFRWQMVDLVRSGRDLDDLACEHEPTAQVIRTWVAGAGGRTGDRPEKGLLPGESDEMIRLRRENRQLRQERDILAKAAAWASRARPARGRPGFRGRGRASGQLSRHRHGAGARGVDGRVLRVAQAAAIDAGQG